MKNESNIGKVLSDENAEEYLILSEMTYKKIDCVYAMKVMADGSEGVKKFFQLSLDKNESLITITSKKMIKELSELADGEDDTKPRKIFPKEPVSDYVSYLDEYYKDKVL